MGGKEEADADNAAVVASVGEGGRKGEGRKGREKKRGGACRPCHAKRAWGA